MPVDIGEDIVDLSVPYAGDFGAVKVVVAVQQKNPVQEDKQFQKDGRIHNILPVSVAVREFVDIIEETFLFFGGKRDLMSETAAAAGKTII